jgi:hypothetical protein
MTVPPDNAQEGSAHALVARAEARLVEAGLAGQPTPEDLAAAKDDLLAAESIARGSGSWRLACIAAMQNHSDLCMRWLRRAHDHGALPEGAVDDEPALAAFRGQKWFKRFLRSLG